MALQSARQLLDELMGRERDLRPTEKNTDEPEWSDPKICKFFLVNFCPNQLFTNTKADMGPCHKVHDDFIKKAFEEKASRREKMAYEDEFIRFCQQTLNDVERRIKRARQRLATSQMDKSTTITSLPGSGASVSEEIQEKMTAISEKIEDLLVKIEELGCEGKVEEAQDVMKQVESLKEQKAALKRENLPMHWIQQRAEIGAAQEKQMEVCDVCGAFLIVNDVQQRVDDHLMGKQHVGYGKLKAALDELLQKRKSERESSSNDRKWSSSSKRSGSRSPSRSRSRSRSRSKSRSRERRDRDRRYRDGHRSSNKRNHYSFHRSDRRRSHPKQSSSSKYRNGSRSRSPRR